MNSYVIFVFAAVIVAASAGPSAKIVEEQTKVKQSVSGSGLGGSYNEESITSTTKVEDVNVPLELPKPPKYEYPPYSYPPYYYGGYPYPPPPFSYPYPSPYPTPYPSQYPYYGQYPVLPAPGYVSPRGLTVPAGSLYSRTYLTPRGPVSVSTVVPAPVYV